MDLLRGLAWLLVFQTAGEGIARGLSLPLPGPVVAALLLFPALAWPPLRPPIGTAATALLGNLSLLFVPVGVGVITHLDLIPAYGLRLLSVIVVSTLIGLVVTALTLDALFKRIDRQTPIDEAGAP